MNPKETDIKHNRNVTDGEPLSDADDDENTLDDDLDDEEDLDDEDAGEE